MGLSEEAVSLESPQDLSTLLLRDQLVTYDQLKIATLEANKQEKSLEASLVGLGFISQSALAAAIAESRGVEHLDLKTVVLEAELLENFPQNQAQQHQVLPLSLDKRVLRLAMVDVYNVPALDYIRASYPEIKKIFPVVVSESDLLEAIDRYYGYEMSIHGILAEIESDLVDLSNVEDYINPTVRLVDAIILDAVKLKASDIHFEPEGAFMRIRYRVDGILRQIRTLHSTYWPALCVRLKVIAGMNIAESRKPQNGRFSFFVGSREVDFRVASHPTVYGENMVLRILDKTRSLLSLDQLGYSTSVIEKVKSALQKPEGIFIITGPTGSGKTTSLYSMLSHISTLEVNIMTLEEPVEYRLPLIRQSHVKETLSFSEGVKSILRQDPDIILIGEIRDQATASMALRAAMTGHQVFTTLHTHDAIGALSRLEDLGLKPSLLAGHISGIIAQRLVRSLCSCKTEERATDAEWQILGGKHRPQIAKPQGCFDCHQIGFKGRMALAEIIKFDDQLDELVLTQANRIQYKQYLEETGHSSLVHEARRFVLEKRTSLEEILRTVDLRGGE